MQIANDDTEYAALQRRRSIEMDSVWTKWIDQNDMEGYESQTQLLLLLNAVTFGILVWIAFSIYR